MSSTDERPVPAFSGMNPAEQLSENYFEFRDVCKAFDERPVLRNVTFAVKRAETCRPGAPRQDQYRAGRYELQMTAFETIELNTREQLQSMLSGGGFDAVRDIAAITVNRWAHGYAYEYDWYSDRALPAGPRPNVVGRKPFGNITIANSDAAARAYTDAAMDEAWRAVQELRTGFDRSG